MDNWTIAKLYELIHSLIPRSINDEIDFWERMETGKGLNEYELFALKRLSHILDLAGELGVVELKTTDMLSTILGTSKKKSTKSVSKKSTSKEQPTYIKEVVYVGGGNSGWSDESHAQYVPKDTSYDNYDDGMGY